VAFGFATVKKQAGEMWLEGAPRSFDFTGAPGTANTHTRNYMKRLSQLFDIEIFNNLQKMGNSERL
jgi:hypothetical protein